MATKVLVAKLPEKLYHEFIETVVKGGKWDPEIFFTEGINLAVENALKLLIKDSRGKLSLPEFREYASEKYPDLDEYLVSLIENLLAQGKKRNKKRKHHWG